MQIPTDPKKIRDRIRRYERNWKSPLFRDGSGTRFLIGPFYLLLGDLEGAVKHYKWFQRKFSDSMDEPIHTLSWALTMFRAGNLKDALFRLRRAHCANPYTIPFILGVDHHQPQVRRFCNWAEEAYVLETPSEFFKTWDRNEIEWLKTVWESIEFKEFVGKHRSLVQKLETAPIGSHRAALVDALYGLREQTASKLILVRSADH